MKTIKSRLTNRIFQNKLQVCSELRIPTRRLTEDFSSPKMLRSACKKFFNSSIGRIEVIDEPTIYEEAANYCKEESELINGRLISLPDQQIIDEVSTSLESCQFDIINEICGCRTNSLWNIGINCKDAIYKWVDGTSFDGSKYDLLVDLDKEKCGNVYLDSASRRLISVKGRFKEPFLCLEDRTNPVNEEESKIALMVVLSLICLILVILFWARKTHLLRRQSAPINQQTPEDPVSIPMEELTTNNRDNQSNEGPKVVVV